MTFQQTSFARLVIGSLPGSSQEHLRAQNPGFTTVLAIPVAQAVDWRHRAAVEGGADFRASEATGHRKLRYFGVFTILMIFGVPLSVSDTLQCVSQTRPQWGPVGILVVGVSSRGVAL